MKKLVFIFLIFFCYNTSDTIQRKGRQLGADSSTVGGWHFNAGVDVTAYDFSGNNNHGELFGYPTWIEGLFENCLDFDGNDYVEVGTTSDFDITTPTTILVWIKLISAGGYKAIMSKTENNPTPIQWQFIVDPDDKLYWGMRHQNGSNDADPALISNNVVADNEWHRVGVTYDTITGETELYIDGILDISATLTSGDIVSTARKMQIGDVYYTSRVSYFNGPIESPIIYNRILSSAEMKYDYTSQSSARQ